MTEMYDDAQVMAELFRTMDCAIRAMTIAKRAGSNPGPGISVCKRKPVSATDRPEFNNRPAPIFCVSGSLNWAQINPDIFGSMIQAARRSGKRCAGEATPACPTSAKVLESVSDGLCRNWKRQVTTPRSCIALKARGLRPASAFDPACGSGQFPGDCL